MAAEHGIDQIVRQRYFAGDAGRVLIEVGAARPDYLSFGESFRAAGWEVIAIEPNPLFCAQHRSLGHEVLEYAVSDTNGEDVPFVIVDSNGAKYMDGNVSFESFSSLGIRGRYAELYETVRGSTEKKTICVKVRTLDTLLATHRPDLDRVDLLAIDVEGWELNVMRGFSSGHYQPKIIILENIFDQDEYVEYMRSIGYERSLRLNPNDVFVRKKQ
jgi:FkbM family methyltransferase